MYLLSVDLSEVTLQYLLSNCSFRLMNKTVTKLVYLPISLTIKVNESKIKSKNQRPYPTVHLPFSCTYLVTI